VGSVVQKLPCGDKVRVSVLDVFVDDLYTFLRNQNACGRNGVLEVAHVFRFSRLPAQSAQVSMQMYNWYFSELFTALVYAFAIGVLLISSDSRPTIKPRTASIFRSIVV
jgi:hypothetical protein